VRHCEMKTPQLFSIQKIIQFKSSHHIVIVPTIKMVITDMQRSRCLLYRAAYTRTCVSSDLVEENRICDIAFSSIRFRIFSERLGIIQISSSGRIR